MRNTEMYHVDVGRKRGRFCVFGAAVIAVALLISVIVGATAIYSGYSSAGKNTDTNDLDLKSGVVPREQPFPAVSIGSSIDPELGDIPAGTDDDNHGSAGVCFHVIDTFEDGILYATDNIVFASEIGDTAFLALEGSESEILGGERDLWQSGKCTRTPSESQGASIGTSFLGQFSGFSTVAATGIWELSYDGLDDSNDLNLDGLTLDATCGCQTGGVSDKFVVDVSSQDYCHEISLEVFSKDGYNSSLTVSSPIIERFGSICVPDRDGGSVYFPFDQFQATHSGHDVDFSNLAAIKVSLDGQKSSLEGFDFGWDYFGVGCCDPKDANACDDFDRCTKDVCQKHSCKHINICH